MAFSAIQISFDISYSGLFVYQNHSSSEETFHVWPEAVSTGSSIRSVRGIP
jgi:hypothetical protein